MTMSAERYERVSVAAAVLLVLFAPLLEPPLMVAVSVGAAAVLVGLAPDRRRTAMVAAVAAATAAIVAVLIRSVRG